MTTIVDITQLTAGTVKNTDVYPAVDTTDTTQATTGTTKKYTILQLATFLGGGGGGEVTWQTVAGTTQQMVINNGYIPLNIALTTLTLPVTAAVGTKQRIGGFGSGGWALAQNAGQSIHFGMKVTTTGVTGSITSINQYNCLELVCVVANTTWLVLSSIGNMNVN